MNKNYGPISDAHVHAYVDNELNKDRREVVEDFIVALPIRCKQVRSYRKINEMMRQAYSIEKIPYKYKNNFVTESPATRKFRLVKKPKSVMLFGIMLGLIAGWLVFDYLI